MLLPHDADSLCPPLELLGWNTPHYLCICGDRYLCPQEPPAGIGTVCKCAHYVRLLPFLEDWQMFEGVDDMWCTSQQFLVGKWGVCMNLVPRGIALYEPRHKCGLILL